MLSKSLKLLLAHVFIQEKDHLQLEMITDVLRTKSEGRGSLTPRKSGQVYFSHSLSWSVNISAVSFLTTINGIHWHACVHSGSAHRGTAKEWPALIQNVHHKLRSLKHRLAFDFPHHCIKLNSVPRQGFNSLVQFNSVFNQVMQVIQILTK